MRNFAFFIVFNLCFHLYGFKEENWDDEFLNCFFFFPIVDEKAFKMLSDCIYYKKTYDSIDNLCEAIGHYKANKDGKTIPATDNLIEHMKEYSDCRIKWTGRKFYKDVKKELKKLITEKIKQKKKENGNKGTEIIQNSPGAFRSPWYLTLGSYQLFIEYYEKVDLSKTKFTFNVHFHGEDLWDFASKDCSDKSVWKKFACLIDNFFEEIVPDLLVGSGTEYKISYSFDDIIEINTNSILLSSEDDDDCATDSSTYLFLNSILILLFWLF